MTKNIKPVEPVANQEKENAESKLEHKVEEKVQENQELEGIIIPVPIDIIGNLVDKLSALPHALIGSIMQTEISRINSLPKKKVKYERTPNQAGCMRANWIMVVISIMIMTNRLALLFRIYYSFQPTRFLSTQIIVKCLS